MARDPKQDDVTLEEATAGNLRFKKRSKKDFTQIENVITFCQGLSDGAYRTYVMICSKDWGDHPKMPTLAELAEWQGKSTRAIFTHICELRQASLIVYVRQGLGKPNDIDVTAEEQWTLSALGSERKKTSDSPRRKKTSEPAGKILPIQSEENFRTTRKKTAEPSIDNTFSHTNTNTPSHTGGADKPRRAAAQPIPDDLKEPVKEFMALFHKKLWRIPTGQWPRQQAVVVAGMQQYTPADLLGCLRYKLTTPGWTLGGNKRPQYVVDDCATWIAQGRPACAAGNGASRPKSGIPRMGTATDAQIRAAHADIQICEDCHRELGWGTCDACRALGLQEGE